MLDEIEGLSDADILELGLKDSLMLGLIEDDCDDDKLGLTEIEVEGLKDGEELVESEADILELGLTLMEVEGLIELLGETEGETEVDELGLEPMYVKIIQPAPPLPPGLPDILHPQPPAPPP
jgi:hypothetical protein